MAGSYFHTCCYYGSVANGTTLVDVPLVNDQILTRANNHAILGQPAKLLQVASLSTTLQRVRLNTPSARYVSLPYMQPVNASATIPTVPSIAKFGFNPLTIPRADEVAFEAVHGGAGAENVVIAVWFGFAFRDVPPGQRYRVRATASITASAGTWQNGSITLDNTLPAGDYAIVGLDVLGTNLFAARLILQGESWRPGCLCRDSEADVPDSSFTDGTLGQYGQFNSINTPNLEILSVGANTSQTVYMDLIRING